MARTTARCGLPSFGSARASSVAQTSLAVSGRPLWNRTPGRRSTARVRSLVNCQLCATSGTGASVSGSSPASPAWTRRVVFTSCPRVENLGSSVAISWGSTISSGRSAAGGAPAQLAVSAKIPKTSARSTARS